MVWATVSSWSYFCWLYRASSSLAANNIINLISVLTIWWWLNGRESEWTPGVGEGQGGLACCNSWGPKESDTTEWLIWSHLMWDYLCIKFLMFVSCSVVSDSLRPHELYVAHQASPFMEFSRQEYCSGLPFPSPEDLPDPGIEPWSPRLNPGLLHCRQILYCLNYREFSNSDSNSVCCSRMNLWIRQTEV